MRLAVAWFFVFGLAVSGAAQAQTSTYSVPRTPWGDPDLQGIWPGNVTAPLQRPVELGERAPLTAAELAQREAQAKAQAAADAQEFVSAGRGGRGGRGGGGLG